MPTAAASFISLPAFGIGASKNLNFADPIQRKRAVLLFLPPVVAGYSDGGRTARRRTKKARSVHNRFEGRRLVAAFLSNVVLVQESVPCFWAAKPGWHHTPAPRSWVSSSTPTPLLSTLPSADTDAPRTHLVFIGDGPFRASLQTLCVALGVPPYSPARSRTGPSANQEASGSLISHTDQHT
ncbi:hypothetical protein K438DRAFT_1785121 [Mycena galopus ATCC 62051]|nr:hypothetical protein K438DRAFT_1785121 [Mycena galopus ATCC 62051]